MNQKLRLWLLGIKRSPKTKLYVYAIIIIIILYAIVQIGSIAGTLYKLLHPKPPTRIDLVMDEVMKTAICSPCDIGLCQEPPLSKFQWSITANLQVFENLKV